MILACLFLFLSVSAQQNIPAVSLVPDKSVAVLRVNWTNVRKEESLKKIVNGGDFDKVTTQFGLSENKVTEWIVFSDINPASSSGLGIIISGNFTLQSIVQSVEAKNWNLETLNRQKVYVNPTDGSYLLPIRNGLLVFGTKNGVEKVQNAVADPKKRLIRKSPFSSLFAQLGDAAPIKCVIGVPQEYQKVADIAFKITTKLMSFTGFGLFGTIFDKIGLIQSAGFSFSKRRDFFPVHLIATMPDIAKAKIGASVLNLLKSLPNWMSSQTEENAALQSLVVASSGKILSVKFNMPESAMAQP